MDDIKYHYALDEQNRLINIVNDETADKIKKYIDEHISEKITADVL